MQSPQNKKMKLSNSQIPKSDMSNDNNNLNVNEETVNALKQKVSILEEKLKLNSKWNPKITSGLWESVGNTPLIELKSLSKETGCTILAKAEHLNPGGSVKDRAAKFIIQQAEIDGTISPGKGVIIEATGGNTGIGLALLSVPRGYRCILCLHENISKEKCRYMEQLGAKVVVCPCVGFDDSRHYYKTAERLSKETPHGFFTNQFENMANCKAHYTTTGPEIWEQAKGKVDGLCVSSGTGGTISGLSNYLKEKNPKLQCYLIDDPSSGLYSWVEHGEIKKRGTSCAYEGIGLNRVTANFSHAKIDGAFKGSDKEGVEMCYYLLRNEGLFVGPSAALNCVGAVKLARKLGPGHVIVTVLCDSGVNYVKKVYSQKWLEEKKLVPEAVGTSLEWISSE